MLLRFIPLAVKKQAFLTKKVKAIFENEEALTQRYKSVSICFQDEKATIVPTSFLRENEVQNVMELNQEMERNEVAGTTMIKSFSQAIVFSYPGELLDFFGSVYSEYKFSHSTYPLLNATIQQKGKAEKTIVIKFGKKHFQLILLKENIQLYNTFFYKTESDFLFHTLNICKKLDFNAEKDEVFLCGLVNEGSDYVRQLKKYIMKVKFLKPDHDLNYSYTFAKLPEHTFAALFNSYKCEL